MGVVRRVSLAFARGLALFLGAFSLANSIVVARGLASEDIWWLDLHFVPLPVAALLSLAAGSLLFAWAVAPRASRSRRYLTAAACALLFLVACVNVADFYAAWAAGTIAPAVSFPSSLLVAFALALVGAIVLIPVHGPLDAWQHAGAAAVVALLVLAFPLMNVAFFGTTDYRAPADVAVVFGAKVMPSGRLSTSLDDRVRTAVHLYRAGLVRRLVMSGGVGASGIDETEAMRRAAIEAGVPPEAIELDHEGLDTDATVRDTTALFERDGTRRVLAVSQFYHLPRIKMAYRAAGWQVRTVPAEPSRPIPETRFLVFREIPAFWAYWLRDLARAATG